MPAIKTDEYSHAKKTCDKDLQNEPPKKASEKS